MQDSVCAFCFCTTLDGNERGLLGVIPYSLSIVSNPSKRVASQNTYPHDDISLPRARPPKYERWSLPRIHPRFHSSWSSSSKRNSPSITLQSRAGSISANSRASERKDALPHAFLRTMAVCSSIFPAKRVRKTPSPSEEIYSMVTA